METGQVTYGSYGIVTVLEREGNLTRISTGDYDFWVRTEKLKPVRTRRKAPTAAPNVDEAANAWQRFVNYLQHTGYRLEVHTRAAGLDAVESEYIAWAGESLPQSAIHIYENRPTDRCWRLFFFLQDGISVPFPIELYGVTGKHPTNKPRGLWQQSGKVDVYFTSIIEQLVRAGLRVPAEA